MTEQFLKDNFSLEGKVALITGASYGIGFSIATALLELEQLLSSMILSKNSLTKASPPIKNLALRPMAMFVMLQMKMESTKWWTKFLKMLG